MTFRRLKYLFLLIPALLIGACSEDAFDFDSTDSGSGDGHKKGRFAITLRVKMDDNGGSRAASDDSFLADGEHNEHALNRNGHFALFFDADNKFFSYTPLELGNEDENPEEEADVIETIYTAVLDADSLEKLPKWCLIILNGEYLAGDFQNFDDTNDIDDALGTLISSGSPYGLGRDKDGYFTMANSIYFDKDMKLQSAVEVTEKMVYETSDINAKNMADVLIVHVERLLAKFSFGVESDGPNEDGEYMYYPQKQQLVLFEGVDGLGAPIYTARNWCIAITGWNVNALENSVYLFKQVNPNPNYFFNWDVTSPDAYRTYWAEDFHYGDDDDYAWQYRTSRIFGLNSYSEKPKVLQNYSFKALGLDDKDFGKTVYVPENTYSYDKLADKCDDRVDLLAGTHVLIGGRLMLAKSIGATDYVVQDLFRDREGFYYTSENDLLRSLRYNINNSLSSQSYMQFTYYDWGGNYDEKGDFITQPGQITFARSEGKYYLYYVDMNGNETEVDDELLDKWETDYEDNNFLAIGVIRGGDGKRMPWPAIGKFTIKDENGDKLQIWTRDIVENWDKYVREVNDDDVKSILYEWFGAVDRFNQGKMYYSAPAVIRKGLLDGKNDICGTVRNSWYAYNLQDVTKIGTPVDDPLQPIIPDLVENYDELNITIKILDWHLVYNYWPIF